MALLTREQKLDNKGIIHFVTDGVFARLSAKQSADADVARAVRPLVGAGAVLAAHIRARMSRGIQADGSVRMQKDGRRPIGLLSGGTWRGVESIGTGGRTQTELRFDSRQSDAEPSFREIRSDLKRRIRMGKTPRAAAWETIRNDLKALSVWKRTGIHMIEPSNAEVAAVSEAIGNDIGKAIVYALGGGPVAVGPFLSAGADASLRAKLAAQWTR